MRKDITRKKGTANLLLVCTMALVLDFAWSHPCCRGSISICKGFAFKCVQLSILPNPSRSALLPIHPLLPFPPSLPYCSVWLWTGPGRLLRAAGWIHLYSGLPANVRDSLLQLPRLHRGGGGVRPGQDLPPPLLRLRLLQVRNLGSRVMFNARMIWFLLQLFPCKMSKFRLTLMAVSCDISKSWVVANKTRCPPEVEETLIEK